MYQNGCTHDHFNGFEHKLILHAMIGQRPVNLRIDWPNVQQTISNTGIEIREISY